MLIFNRWEWVSAPAETIWNDADVSHPSGIGAFGLVWYVEL